MYKDSLFFSLPPELQFQFAEDIGGRLIQNKIIEIPSDLGKGQVFYIQAIPGMALLLWDCKIKKPLKIKTYKDNIQRYIFHYDLSEQPNFLIINNKKIKIGNSINLGLTVFNNQKESFFEPSMNERTFAMRLYIDHKLIQPFVTNNKNVLKKLETARKKFYCDDIDGNSLLRILSLNEKSIYDESFDAFIKGIALNLLGNFLKKYTDNETKTSDNIHKSEKEGLLSSKNYLISHLNEHFPSIAFLSKLAGMSGTKFKILFKKKFNNTANDFFIQQKMEHAHKMLQSGDYNSLTEIMHELNFNKIQPFSSRYFQIFNKKPSEDFIKK
ncbi:AraC family transcriptional regulator [Flavobacterium aquidurense]|uniref:AraC family transcriptional regulator n=1 Tax=Flavobacterium aquidurense TaxID=362413 RepID=UPI00285E73B7|nr:AraC family transcriptional regulator [Flavobacterium aquidurense]MDR7371728.1 AraC-like DNA-binding protein [Flavobacterium aquidurense]